VNTHFHLVGHYRVRADGHEEWEILLAMVLQGVGFGMAYAAMSNLVVQGVPPEQTGVASGMNANIRTIGGSIGAAVMSSIVTSTAGIGGLPPRIGVYRADVTGTDVTIALWAVRGIIETTQGHAPEAWQRHLDIVIAATPARGRPPS